MNGTQLLAATISNGKMGAEWSPLSVGDFDGNGRDDILWRSTSGDLSVWSMNGANVQSLSDASFNGAPGNLGGAWEVGGVADFSGDGNEDIVWVNSTNNDFQIWEMNDQGDVANISFPAGHLGIEWELSGVAELTGDTTPDLLWSNDAGETIILGMRAMNNANPMELPI